MTSVLVPCYWLTSAGAAARAASLLEQWRHAKYPERVELSFLYVQWRKVADMMLREEMAP